MPLRRSICWLLILAGIYPADSALLPRLCTDMQVINLLRLAIPDRGNLPNGVDIINDQEFAIHAYRFKSRSRRLHFPAFRVFTKCNHFPEEFSILVTMKVLKNSKEKEYLFSLIQGNEKPRHLKLGLHIFQEKITFEYTDHATPLGRKKIFRFKDPTIMDKKWHTLIVSVKGQEVTFALDCEKIKKKTLNRSFPAMLDTQEANFHVGNRNRERQQFSGLLKELIIVPGSDILSRVCPSKTPSLPNLNFMSEQGMYDNAIPKDSVMKVDMQMDSICTWQEAGKLAFDSSTNSLHVCNNAMWLPVMLQKATPPKLDYLDYYQEITTPAPSIDLEFFTIPGEGTFMVLASFDSKNGGKQKSPIYKWINNQFVSYQNITTYGAQGWEFFTLNNQYFLAVANYGVPNETEASSRIYRWNRTRRKFGKYQDITTYKARDFEFFEADGNNYLIVANHAKGLENQVESIIYKWDQKTRLFVPALSVYTISAYDWTHFRIDGYLLLAVANALNQDSTRMDSWIYLWQEEKLIPFQAIETTGATDWEHFTIGNDVFLAVANAYNFGPQNYRNLDMYHVNSTIYKFNQKKKQFEKFQQITTDSAIDWEAFTIGDDVYLAVSNSQSDGSKSYEVAKSRIFRWQGVEKFVQIHSLETYACADWEVLKLDGQVYLGYANPKGTVSQLLKVKLSY